MQPERLQKLKKYLLAGILLITFLTYLPSLNNGFTNWDDPEQLLENKDIGELSFQGTSTIFSSFYVGMYQPLTMQVYALIQWIFGPSAMAFHAISLILHLINILLVYLLVKGFIKQEVPALFTAALFATNPLQTESVAWVSAMSNLLYTAFFLAGIIIYLKYLRQKNIRLLISVFVLFVLSILSKPAAMTFPVMILFADLYYRRRDYGRLILEKLPFFLLAISMGIVVLYARQEAGHIIDVSDRFNWGERILLISYAVAFYVSMLFIPSGLSAFHPYPSDSLPVAYFLAPLVVIMLVFLLFRLRGEVRRHVWAGIFFFLISIAVVLEFIPLGVQVVKERYVYLPSVGLYFTFSMLMLFIFSHKYKRFPALITLGLIVFFSISSFGRVQVWKDSLSLWNDVLAKYPDASAPLINRGNSWQQEGDFTRAITDYTMALTSEPAAADAYMNRGLAYFKLGSKSSALDDIDMAISLGIADAEIYNIRGLLRVENRDFANALEDFHKAVTLDSTHTNAWVNMALVHANGHDYPMAREALGKALGTDPAFAKAYYWRGMVYLQEKKYAEACEDMKKAVSFGWPAEQVPEFCK